MSTNSAPKVTFKKAGSESTPGQHIDCRRMLIGPDGSVEVQMKLPDLIGQMRLMAIAIDQDRYGRAEQALTLTSELIVEASWPRFAAPDDTFEVPVKLFNTTDEPMSVRVAVVAGGAPGSCAADRTGPCLATMLGRIGPPARLHGLRFTAGNSGTEQCAQQAESNHCPADEGDATNGKPRLFRMYSLIHGHLV